MSTTRREFVVRSARPDDVEGILAVKRALTIGRVAGGPAREGFLLGSSPEGYAEMVRHGIGYVIERAATGAIKGFGFALPWAMLRETEVWRKRSLVCWTDGLLAALEAGRPGYIDQLAVLPSRTIRFLAPGVGLAMIEALLARGHTHVLATTVTQPIRNEAALKLLGLVRAMPVGEIAERYDGIGDIRSQVHCVAMDDYLETRASPTWRGRLLGYLEKTTSDRSGPRGEGRDAR